MADSELCDLQSQQSAKKPHLSDAITFYGDIAPHRSLHLYAGVGAGKNDLIQKIIAGCPEKGIPRLIVLLITSRKSKVIEMLSKYPKYVLGKLCDERNYYDIVERAPLSLEEYQYPIQSDGRDYIITQRSVICTNAAIEKYHQYCYDPTDPSTHLWNRFDLIVWDEVHSLVMDSSYQSAPYHVMRLFQETYRKMIYSERGQINPASGIPRCRNLLMMTGTPKAIAEVAMMQDTHYLDLRDVCCTVEPRNIHFIDTRCAQRQIKDQLDSGERILYFANHVPEIATVANTYGIDKTRFTISFSDEDKRKALKKRCKAEQQSSDSNVENDYTRMENVENYLAEHSRIRPDIDLFVTTSRNKEGIDIKDDDIRHVYIESHCLTDIRQMAGRIRSGVEHLYIITDAKPIFSPESFFESDYDKDMCCKYLVDENGKLHCDKALDAQLRHFCQQNFVSGLVGNADSLIRAYDDKHSKIGQYIDYIKKIHPYVQYDYFLNGFFYNNYRKLSRDFIDSENKAFNEALETPEGLMSMFQQAFPKAHIHPPVTAETTALEYIKQFLEAHPNGEINKQQKDLLTADLGKIFYPDSDGKKHQLCRMLHSIGYECTTFGKNKQRESYGMSRIYPLNNSEAA